MSRLLSRHISGTPRNNIILFTLLFPIRFRYDATSPFDPTPSPPYELLDSLTIYLFITMCISIIRSSLYRLLQRPAG